MLCLLAFNWAGYRIFSACLVNRSDAAIHQQIDQNTFNNDELVEFRISLKTPYLAGSVPEFERVDGEAEINGIIYTYVKRKIENGQLVLLCLPNNDKKRLQGSSVDFFKLVNDIEHPSKAKDPAHSGAFKNLLSEYQQESNCWNISAPLTIFQPYTTAGPGYHLSGFHTLPKQPPQA